MSKILTSKIPVSLYVKSATWKCGGWFSTDITDGFKSFLDRTTGGDDISNYLCSSGSEYASLCLNGGGNYKGIIDGDFVTMLSKLRVPIDSDGGDGCSGGIIITGVNDVEFNWSWGSILDLSAIVIGNPLSEDDKKSLDKVISIENKMKTFL